MNEQREVGIPISLRRSSMIRFIRKNGWVKGPYSVWVGPSGRLALGVFSAYMQAANIASMKESAR